MLLRYPGGKSRGALAKRIIAAIKGQLVTSCGKFGELFFGGGGITFALLKEQHTTGETLIKQLLINDLDISIAVLWNNVIHDPRRLQRDIANFQPSVPEFVAAKERVRADRGSALDTIVVNRLSHGGRGVMGGPQGGVAQTGNYKIGCRWNGERLIADVEEAHRLLTSVKLYGDRCGCQGFDAYMGEKFNDFVFYLDPPYIAQGPALYQHSFAEGHDWLAASLSKRRNWVLSYDNHTDVFALYRQQHIETMSHAGNGGSKQEDRELIITPRNAS